MSRAGHSCQYQPIAGFAGSHRDDRRRWTSRLAGRGHCDFTKLHRHSGVATRGAGHNAAALSISQGELIAGDCQRRRASDARITTIKRAGVGA
jgi:hypothetical protein